MNITWVRLPTCAALMAECELIDEFFEDWADSHALPDPLRLYLWEIHVADRLPGSEMPTDAPGPYAVLFCRTAAGDTCTVVVHGWKPWFRLMSKKPVPDWKPVLEKLELGPEHKRQRLHKLYGYVPDPARPGTTANFDVAEVPLGSVWKAKKPVREHMLKPLGLIATDTQHSPVMRFLIDTGLSPCCWFTLRKYENVTDADDRLTISTHELVAHVSALVPDLQDESPAALRLASFDCEMSSVDDTFPSPHKGDQLKCVSTVFKIEGSPGMRTVSIYAGAHAATSTETHLVLQAGTPERVMELWRYVMQTVDPDLVTGWNINGFDFAFMAQAYTTLFDPADLRGTEELQQALRATLPPAFQRRTLQELFSAMTAKEAAALRARVLDQMGVDVFNRLQQSLHAHVATDSLLDDDEDDDLPDDKPCLISAREGNEIRIMMEKPGAVSAARLDAIVGSLPPETEALLGPETRRLLLTRRAGRKVGMKLSRFRAEEPDLKTKFSKTAAKGENVTQFIPMTGRVIVDMMRIIKDDKKPNSNDLRSAADSWLGHLGISKLDMPHLEMFSIFRADDPAGAARIIEYCARDAEIPLLLIDNLKYITNWTGLCKVCFLNPNVIINGGQQQRVFSRIARRVRTTHAINVEPSGWPEFSVPGKPDYVGATVIEPQAAFYDKPLSTLDFASLYPSIEASNNLCFSTLVTDRALLPKLVDEKVRNQMESVPQLFRKAMIQYGEDQYMIGVAHGTLFASFLFAVAALAARHAGK